MHIPDGFLSTPVWAAFDVASLPALGLMARHARNQVDETKIPLLGVMGAFVFAAQMINFPVGVGTSGHLVGGALLSCTLGLAPAAMVMTAILVIQAFLFQDGGVLALGANLFNMAVAGVLAGYLPSYFWAGTRWRKPAVFLGGFLSVVLSACLALAELLLSGVHMPGAVLTISLILFAISGLLEGAITLAVVEAIERLNPSWIKRPEPTGKRTVVVLGLAAVFLVSAGILLASTAPDGVWSLAGQLGLASQAKNFVTTPFADYQIPVFASAWMRRAAAGLAGLALTYIVCTVLWRAIARFRSA